MFNAEVIYGLANHYQDSEERDRGAQHYLAGKGIVDKCTVMLVNVLVDLLVGDKNQYIVQSFPARVDIFSSYDFLQSGADVPNELLTIPVFLRRVPGFNAL